MAADIELAIQEIETEFATLYGEDVTFVFGQTALHEHQYIPPCVVFTHRGGSHQSADISKQESVQEARTTNAVLSYAVETIRAECRGADNEAADNMWRFLCAVVVETWKEKHAAKLGAFGWRTEDPNTASLNLGWSVKWQDIQITTVVPAAEVLRASALTTEHEGYLNLEETGGEGCQCSEL